MQKLIGFVSSSLKKVKSKIVSLATKSDPILASTPFTELHPSLFASNKFVTNLMLVLIGLSC